MDKKEATRIKTKWRRPGTNKPNVPATPPVENQNSPVEAKVSFLINDPTTPNLIISVPVPEPSTPPIKVYGYKGGGFGWSSAEGQAASCHVTISNTLKYYNSKTDNPLNKWATNSNLLVVPRAGVNLNAYYNRRTLSFFYASDPKIGGSVYTADSTDIVAHELGHAVLDGYRPDTWNAASIEIAAFHEAFGDFTAIIHLMQYDDILASALVETNSDLKQLSVITRLAEQFGKAIYQLSPQGRNPQYLRCAVNDFKYVNPVNLPTDVNSENELAAECHNFSRIFLGALWDILLLIFEERKTSLEPIPALKEARDIIATYVLKAIQNAPLNVRFYEAVAKTILWADVVLNNRKYHDQMQEVFFNRNILVPQVGILSIDKSHQRIIKRKHKMTVKMNQVMVTALSGTNPLLDVHVEIPCESVKLYDNEGHFYDVCRCSHHESCLAAADMLNLLHKTNSVSPSDDTPFEIKKNTLCRTHMTCCSCGI